MPDGKNGVRTASTNTIFLLYGLVSSKKATHNGHITKLTAAAEITYFFSVRSSISLKYLNTLELITRQMKLSLNYSISKIFTVKSLALH